MKNEFIQAREWIAPNGIPQREGYYCPECNKETIAHYAPNTAPQEELENISYNSQMLKSELPEVITVAVLRFEPV